MDDDTGRVWNGRPYQIAIRRIGADRRQGKYDRRRAVRKINAELGYQTRKRLAGGTIAAVP